jgi:hypothetical protein
VIYCSRGFGADKSRVPDDSGAQWAQESGVVIQ